MPCNGHLLKVRSCLLLISWFLAERKRSCNVPACGSVFTCVCARVSARQSACVCACVRKSKWECKCISCAWVRVGEQACSPLVLRTSARVRVKAWKYVFKKRSYVSWSLSPLQVERLWLTFWGLEVDSTRRSGLYSKQRLLSHCIVDKSRRAFLKTNFSETI